MTYQHTASDTLASRIPGRGLVNAPTPFLTARRALGQIGALFAALGEALLRAADSASRVDRIEALTSKSDEDLARMGIKRADIVHVVFRDLCYV